jgi:site-specific DNA-methyltransferase (adenine-specific)
MVSHGPDAIFGVEETCGLIPYQTIRSREDDHPHPATFPIELAENCIKLHGHAEELTMLDPFLCIGSAALAARR